jgi:hypothetical protein
MEGIVKIGLTKRSADERAIEISRGTGIPTPYVVVHEEYVSNCETVENLLHQQFALQRVNRNKEFFRIPIKVAVRTLQEVAADFKISKAYKADYETSQAIEISSHLRQKYASYIKPDIVSVKIVQRGGACFLEVTRRQLPDSLNEYIERTDLSLITGGEHNKPMFNTSRTVQENADIFVEKLDLEDIGIYTNLLTLEAIKELKQRLLKK